MAEKLAEHHWRARANDYRGLKKTMRDPELRQVLEHLALVCEDMANATEAPAADRKPPAWIEKSNVAREATAYRWRIREAEYLVRANSCQSADGIAGWRTLAGRCAELAAYLEATAIRRVVHS
jgi:hypothetical protein